MNNFTGFHFVDNVSDNAGNSRNMAVLVTDTHTDEHGFVHIVATVTDKTNWKQASVKFNAGFFPVENEIFYSAITVYDNGFGFDDITFEPAKEEKETVKTQIEFKTGRDYGIEQILHIEVTSHIIDEFGFIDFEATFTDSARGITGAVCSFAVSEQDIPKAVLAAYDEGRYTDPRTPEANDLVSAIKYFN